MAWTVACYCGATFQCTPPAACPACGIPVTDPSNPGTVDAWIANMRAEIPQTGTTSWDQHHEQW